MTLKSSEELAQVVAEILHDVRARLCKVLPNAECHHIGSTAVPGSLTKGDIDVLLRVERAGFLKAVEVLRGTFDVKQPENWEPHFASFGSDTMYALPLGIQIVVKDSEADFFLFVRDHLISHPEALEHYNRLKVAYVDKSADEYWHAKDRFLASIVAKRDDRSARD